jgi:hypothetical protein
MAVTVNERMSAEAAASTLLLALVRLTGASVGFSHYRRTVDVKRTFAPSAIRTRSSLLLLPFAGTITDRSHIRG